MPTRRTFIRNAAMTAGAVLAGQQLLQAADYFSPVRLTILHTNDTHSRIEPFPMDGGRYEGLGGVARRAELIRAVRQEEEQVLLLDAGDIFQGTPYFNLYKGETEIKAMTAMGYDACTIGNHDFDAGMENLAMQLTKHASFPMLVANYDFSGTPMEGKTKPYQVFQKGALKIGVFGVGIEGRGLIPDNLFGATQYLDPVLMANKTAATLKTKGCDMVICLSHLGYSYEAPRMCDVRLARETENIDLIIGGHSHTFFEKPVTFSNKKGEDVIVNQVGYAGIILGRLDFEFSKFSGKKMAKNHNISVSRKTVP